MLQKLLELEIATRNINSLWQAGFGATHSSIQISR